MSVILVISVMRVILVISVISVTRVISVMLVISVVRLISLTEFLSLLWLNPKAQGRHLTTPIDKQLPGVLVTQPCHTSQSAAKK